MLNPDQEFHFFSCPKKYAELIESWLLKANNGATTAYLRLFPTSLQLLINQLLVVPVVIPDHANTSLNTLFSHYFKYNLNQMLQYLFDQFLLPALKNHLDNKINKNKIDLIEVEKQINAKLNSILNFSLLPEIPEEFHKDFKEKLGMLIGKIISIYFMSREAFCEIPDRKELTNHVGEDFSKEMKPWFQDKCPTVLSEIDFDKLLKKLIQPIFEAKDLHEKVIKIMQLEYRSFFECMKNLSKVVENFIAHPSLSLPTAYEGMQKKSSQSGWVAGPACEKYHKTMMREVEKQIFHDLEFESFPDTSKPFLSNIKNHNKDYQQTLAVIKTLHANAFSTIRELGIDTNFNFWSSLASEVVRKNTKNKAAICESLYVAIKSKLKDIFPHSGIGCPESLKDKFDDCCNRLSQAVFVSILQYKKELNSDCKGANIEMSLLSTPSFFDPLLNDLLNEIVLMGNCLEKKNSFKKPEEVYRFIVDKSLPPNQKFELEPLLKKNIQKWQNSPDRFNFIVEAFQEFYRKLKLENSFIAFDVKCIIEPVLSHEMNVNGIVINSGLSNDPTNIRRRSNSMLDTPIPDNSVLKDTPVLKDIPAKKPTLLGRTISLDRNGMDFFKKIIDKGNSQRGSPPSSFKKN